MGRRRTPVKKHVARNRATQKPAKTNVRKKNAVQGHVNAVQGHANAPRRPATKINVRQKIAEREDANHLLKVKGIARRAKSIAMRTKKERTMLMRVDINGREKDTVMRVKTKVKNSARRAKSIAMRPRRKWIARRLAVKVVQSIRMTPLLWYGILKHLQDNLPAPTPQIHKLQLQHQVKVQPLSHTTFSLS